jgi:OmpA-OmpF porin, OOP family
MKKIFLTAALMAGFVCTEAQFVYDYLKAADNYYKKGDYYSAASYYEKFLAGNAKGSRDGYNPYTVQATSKKTKTPVTGRAQAIYNLAESYRMLNYHSKAETYYKQVMEMDKAQFPLARYWYATTQRALGNYEEAETAFHLFLDQYTVDDNYTKAARRELQNLRFIQAQLKKDISLFSMAKATAGLNDTGASYAPAWMDNNTLLFTSTRPATAAVSKKDYTNRVYQAAYANGVFSDVRATPLPQPGNVHQGVTAVTPGGNTLYLTRWTIVNGKKTAQIYFSKKTGNEWSEPVALDASVNTANYNAQQPFVMPDGSRLLYASDKPGGKGGFDLWAAELRPDGSVGASVNLGDAINTEYDEQSPYYHAASRTLVFASNGRVGMGGYDLFFTSDKTGNWAMPQNFGYPVNSVKDDIYFASRGSAKNILEHALLSSDRDAACCLELFYLNKTRPLRQVSGAVLACNDNVPLAGVNVIIVDTVTNKTITTQTTDAQGRYSFAIEDYQPLKAIASSTGYVAGSLHFNAPADPEAETMVNQTLCLAPIPTPPVETPIVIDNVFYDFNKSNLRPESYPSLDKVVAMLNENPTMEIEISAHTDNIGNERYNQKLSEARARSVVAYLVSKGIDKARLQSKGYGSARPIAPNRNEDNTDNPAGRQANRRTEFTVIKK